ncbi:MAG: 2-C-methyl-D-erythritol 4-phosphate cytidylyltransferase [Enterobacterales bacterium endosymbiont of Blomia tropicalis]|uniref:2-C-methyl-D-erythritol 4-phosphate cytidylyltransferase n=1 Tax=Mixta mediterraneensis TaxID=2758443 RepID=UPI001875E797|nr:2-C-methyl-D-erythritol 4-phosphate cytidylyltransferase [Mixta mediterraneensis]MBE5253497.1 2-C-methyl-D-erythritol 4-phosphate cytidylyltransferase [Mixta mediterraneensis]MDL4912952.1 2-C-methyl-D-erythritol 4-phosphate cytidylyltransferase [Mixta mediterraneensis]
MNNLSSLDVIAVVPAAGIGSRMQASCPKQYLKIGQHTLLEHSVARLFSHPAIKQVIIALSPDDQHFSTLPLASDRRVLRVIGGETRAESVLAGLDAARSASWVLVHDAARPCLHLEDLSRLLQVREQSHVGGILAAPVRDTMKRGEPGKAAIAHTVERDDLWHALTPQYFPHALLTACLTRALNEGINITDEASALEHCGYHPLLVSGRSDNIKVTRPEDLALAAFYLSQIQLKESA